MKPEEKFKKCTTNLLVIKTEVIIFGEHVLKSTHYISRGNKDQWHGFEVFYLHSQRVLSKQFHITKEIIYLTNAYICMLNLCPLNHMKIETQARSSNKVLLCAGLEQLLFDFILLDILYEQKHSCNLQFK